MSESTKSGNLSPIDEPSDQLNPEARLVDQSESMPEKKRWTDRILDLGRVLEPLVVSVFTVLTLVFLLIPRLKPDEPLRIPSTLGATLSDVRLEERAGRTDGTRYLIVSYDVEFSAFKGSEVAVEWAAFDAATLQRYDLVGNQITPDLPSVDGGRVVAEASTDRASGTIDFPVPLKANCIFIRVYISELKNDGSRTRQDYADTAPFDTHDPANQLCGNGNNPTSIPS